MTNTTLYGLESFSYDMYNYFENAYNAYDMINSRIDSARYGMSSGNDWLTMTESLNKYDSFVMEAEEKKEGIIASIFKGIRDLVMRIVNAITGIFKHEKNIKEEVHTNVDIDAVDKNTTSWIAKIKSIIKHPIKTVKDHEAAIHAFGTLFVTIGAFAYMKKAIGPTGVKNKAGGFFTKVKNAIKGWFGKMRKKSEEITALTVVGEKAVSVPFYNNPTPPNPPASPSPTGPSGPNAPSGGGGNAASMKNALLREESKVLLGTAKVINGSVQALTKDSVENLEDSRAGQKALPRYSSAKGIDPRDLEMAIKGSQQDNVMYAHKDSNNSRFPREGVNYKKVIMSRGNTVYKEM